METMTVGRRADCFYMTYHIPVPTPSVSAIGCSFDRGVPRRGRGKARDEWRRHNRGFEAVFLDQKMSECRESSKLD